ncbi:MAG: MerR family transcriptional regulator, partial [bacterium]|nr:MerR family transcriptional regulator [bacterium]
RANYRLYSPADVERMELIDLYRQAGLALKDVARVLAFEDGAATDLLRRRLRDVSREIRELRRQQQMIVGLLEDEVALHDRVLDKEGWVAILRATGLSEDDMGRWHVEFERLSPDGHRDFLESLGLEDEEVERIREWSRGAEE